MLKKKTELEKVCKKHKIKYHVGMRLVNIAKQLGVDYKDGDTLQDIIDKLEGIIGKK